MKHLILCTLLVFSFNTGFCQTQSLQDVTVEMLKETQSPTDEFADAEVLFEKGEIKFTAIRSWNYEFEVTRRVKIYTKEGFDAATVKIPYYVGESNSDREDISGIKAYVYYLENDKIESEKIRNKDIFDTDENSTWKAHTFTLPNIKEGVIIEYSYTKTSPHINMLPEWIFQNQYPTRYSEYTTEIPIEYLGYSLNTKGYLPFKTNREELEGRLKVSRSSEATSMVKHTHYASNLPKIETESFVKNIKDYLPTIGYELSAYRASTYGEFEQRSGSWGDVVKTLGKTDSFKKELNRTKYFEGDLEFLIGDISSPKEKMEVIYEYVKNKMTWDGKERRYTSEKLDKIYETGVGNSADINLMLTAMLREAGLEANPVLSSTVSNGTALFPSVSGLNYVFTSVNINDEMFLLDATEKFAEPNILPKRVMNWQGIVMKTEDYESLDLTPKMKSKKKYQVQASLDAVGNIEGLCRMVSYDYFGIRARKKIEKKSSSELREDYESAFKFKGISEVSSSNFKESSKPLLESFKFSSEGDFVENIGDKIYVSPMMFMKTNENPFKKEKRDYPIDFYFPQNIDYFISLNIPEGFKIDYLPESVALDFGDQSLKLLYLIEENSGVINIKVTFDINDTFYLPERYPNIRKFYTDLINKENEKIVLVKI
ncbi:DUF3857 domain-containing protein [Psychroflexus sp. YR1-1]|uniref:DUF3857 domain-containing protein n=1 Tax=Psychroflexus aurantiacus TaxID=2709310 RepID=A0A6B3R2E1_9FLAO|nr:DUF3857 domain-containing protein [Psychroflexus aurantiacus]NEV93237.1 DUF3857 domain-containing protein [Psychroflexus aurantiacus]